jgi:hypothetical protein
LQENELMRGAIGWVNAWPAPGGLSAHPEVERFWRVPLRQRENGRYRPEEFRLGAELSAERLHKVPETRCIRGLIVPQRTSGLEH